MGVLKDLGTSYVAGICDKTGYPHGEYGHLLNPLSPRDGLPVDDWDKEGTELYNLTAPYGRLHFAVGSGDDFICYDYATIECVTGRWIILDATINVDTSGWIDGYGYHVLPARSMEEVQQAVLMAANMVGDAVEWCYEMNVRMTYRGWNQRPAYFLNCVARALSSWRFPDKWTDRMMRQNTKLVRKAVQEIMNE